MAVNANDQSILNRSTARDAVPGTTETLACRTERVMTTYNPSASVYGQTAPASRAIARSGRQGSNRQCGYTRLDSLPSTARSGDVAWALVFDWKMNTATSERIEHTSPISKTRHLLGSALLLGGRPLACGRSRRKAGVSDQVPARESARAWVDASYDASFLAADDSVRRSKSAAQHVGKRTRGVKAATEYGLVSQLWQDLMQNCHRTTTRAVTGAVALVSALFIPALFGHDSASAALVTNRNPSLTLDISAQASDSDEWRVDGVNHSNGTATWFWDSAGYATPQSLEALNPITGEGGHV